MRYITSFQGCSTYTQRRKKRSSEQSCRHQWHGYCTIEVLKELWKVEELGNELLHVRARLVDGVVGAGDGEELAIGVVKLAALEVNVQGREGLQSNEKVHYYCCVAVV